MSAKSVLGKSNGRETQSSCAFITQQSVSALSRNITEEKESISPRQENRMTQSLTSSPSELSRCRSFFKEDFILEESRPKETTTSGSDPASSPSSLSSSSSPRESSSSQGAISMSRCLNQESVLSTLVEHEAKLMKQSNAKTVNYEFEVKPIIRDPQRRIRRNSENSSSYDMCSSPLEFPKTDYSVSKDRGIIKSRSQKTVPNLLSTSSDLSPRVLSSIHKSHSLESLSPRNSMYVSQSSTNPKECSNSIQQEQSATRVSSNFSKDKNEISANKPSTNSNSNQSGGMNKPKTTTTNKEHTSGRPIAPFSGKARVIDKNQLDDWDSLNSSRNENKQRPVRKETNDESCLFTPVKSAAGPLRSMGNESCLLGDRQSSEVSKSYMEESQTNKPEKITRSHTSIAESNSKVEQKGSNLKGKTRPAVSLKNSNPNSSSNNSSVRKSVTKSSVSKSISYPASQSKIAPSSQEIGDILAAKLSAASKTKPVSKSLSGFHATVSKSCDLIREDEDSDSDTSSSDAEISTPIKNMFVVTEESMRQGSASKTRMQERITSAKRLKNESPDSKDKEEQVAEVSTKDKPISKVAAKIERSLKKNDTQIALQKKAMSSPVSPSKDKNSQVPKNATSSSKTGVEKTSNTTKTMNQCIKSKESNEVSVESKTSSALKVGKPVSSVKSSSSSSTTAPSCVSSMKPGAASSIKEIKSVSSTASSSNVKYTSSSSVSISTSTSSSSMSSSQPLQSSSSLSSSSPSSTANNSNTVKADGVISKPKQSVSTTAVNCHKKPVCSVSKPEKSTTESKQAKAVDPNVILTPRSTEPLVRIKLQSGTTSSPNTSTLLMQKPNIDITATPLIVNPFEEFANHNTQHTLQHTTEDAVVKFKKQPKQSSSSCSSKTSKKSISAAKRPLSGSSRQSSSTVSKKNSKSKQVKSENQKDSRPRSSKKGGRASKKKEAQDSAVLSTVEDLEKENTDKAIISGIGWQLSTSCIDTSGVQPAKEIPSAEPSKSHILLREEDTDTEGNNNQPPKDIMNGTSNNIAESVENDKVKTGTLSEKDKQALEVFKEKITLHSPRFLEMKRRQSQTRMQLPEMPNDGFPPMNLDMTQADLTEGRDGSGINFSPFEDGSIMEPSSDDMSGQMRSNEALQREIFLNKLTPIPETSFVSRTVTAISKFDQTVKDDRLHELLEETPRESGKSDERIPKSSKASSSLKNNTYEYTYSSSGKTIKRTQSLKEIPKEKKRRERTFSETKSDEQTNQNEEEDNIDEAIEEILCSTVSSTTSTLKGQGHSLRSDKNNTLTEQDQSLLKKLMSPKDSPFYARSAEAARQVTNSPLPPSPQDETEGQSKTTTRDGDRKRVKSNVDSTSPNRSAGRSLSMRNDSVTKSNLESRVVSSSSVSGKPPLSTRSSLKQQGSPRPSPGLVRTTSMKEVGSKGHSGPSIDIKELEMSEEESKHLARVMSSLRHMELHAGSHNTSCHRDGFGGSAKVSKTSSRGDGNSFPSSSIIRPSSTGAAASKFKGKFHELKELGPSSDGKSSSAVGKKQTSQASAEPHQTSHVDEKLIENLSQAADAAEIGNLYIRLTERRDSVCGSEFSMDSGKSVDDTIQWKKGNVLGKGAFGTVWCGLTSEGELIAVKQIELTTMDQAKAQHEYEKIQEEVELLKTLNHINIVGYLGTSLEDNVVSIFMHFIPGGSLASILARFGALEESVFQRYTKQILEGVEYLHDNDVIHRDLKGANVMLMPSGVIKLIDFGCAKRLCINLNLSQTEILKSMKGTPFWMAPEVVNETGHGKKSDIWSIGCTVFEMATRKPPWGEMNPMAAIFAIGRADKPVPTLPDKFSQDAINFVSACMTRDQEKRPSATELLNHVFITKRNTRRLSKVKEDNVSIC